MDQIGRVVALQGDYAVVEVERNRACAKCGICHMGRTDKMFLEVKNVLGADVGKRVLIEMGKSSVLMAGSIVYLLPLLGLIAGSGWRIWSRLLPPAGQPRLVGHRGGLCPLCPHFGRHSPERTGFPPQSQVLPRHGADCRGL